LPSQGYKLDPSILREYDIRGVVGKTLTEEGVRAIGRSFGTIVSAANGKSVAVGYDGRLSSPELEAALVEGLAACGLRVIRVGRGPTPMLYFANCTLGTDAAMMITGSHNPPDYNGIKMVLKGQPFCGHDIQMLGKAVAIGDVATGAGVIIEQSVFVSYVDRLLSDYQNGRPLKVAWDPGNGASGDVLRAICARLPGTHVLLNETIDGTFPNHHPDPTVEKNLEQLRVAVQQEGCDLGVAFDGDGDRIGVIDCRGRILWGDQLLLIFAEEVLADQPGATIIADVKASQVLFDEVERLGGKPLMWQSGHSLIKGKMAETGSPLAGEMSGHIFFSHRYYGFDDAPYAAIRLLSILSRSAVGLDVIRDRQPQMINTPELRIACPEERKLGVVAEVKERLEGIEGISVNDVDGVRVLTADGWWLLRASNTEAVLVARCESSTQDGLKILKSNLAQQLAASAIDVPAEL
jgi:phosphomannomutase